MKFITYINEAFIRKQLEPARGNTYLVKGTTIEGESVFLKYAKFSGLASSEVYIFKSIDTGETFSFKKPFVLGPPNRK